MTTRQKTPTTTSSRASKQTGRNGSTRIFARTVRINAGTSHNDRTTIPLKPLHPATQGRS